MLIFNIPKNYLCNDLSFLSEKTKIEKVETLVANFHDKKELSYI